eukprot:gb/GEZN01008980.1/.p1 GENE.gb/GEZN01008980.1/~~gb/GEZN01008980.1/.p1  ORF type:complete len:352 (-),score=42.45 gb/GEZN01008980.1/:256-1311(-)
MVNGETHAAIFLFVVLGLSGLAAAVITIRRYVVPPTALLKEALRAMGPGKVNVLHASCTIGLYLLSIGTAIDNFRIFTGAFPAAFPPGVYDTKNATLANDAVAAGQIQQAFTYMQVWTWLAFGLHEMGGFLMASVGYYLWAAGSTRVGSWGVSVIEIRGRKIMLSQCNRGYFWWCVILVVQVIIAILGVYGFFRFSVSQGFKLRYKEGLRTWGLKPLRHNPYGSIGILYATLVWIGVGATLWLRHGTVGPWFVVAQLFALCGQRASGHFPVYQPVISNLMEQVTLWSLVCLGLVLTRMQARRQQQPQPSSDFTRCQDRTEDEYRDVMEKHQGSDGLDYSALDDATGKAIEK